MNEELITMRAESVAQLSLERKKPFDCANIFSVLGLIGMALLISAFFWGVIWALDY